MAEKCEWKKSSLSVQISSDIAGIHHSLLTDEHEKLEERQMTVTEVGKKVVPAWGLLWNGWEKIQVKKQKFFFLNQFLIH